MQLSLILQQKHTWGFRKRKSASRLWNTQLYFLFHHRSLLWFGLPPESNQYFFSVTWETFITNQDINKLQISPIELPLPCNGKKRSVISPNLLVEIMIAIHHLLQRSGRSLTTRSGTRMLRKIRRDSIPFWNVHWSPVLTIKRNRTLSFPLTLLLNQRRRDYDVHSFLGLCFLGLRRFK